MTLFEKLAESKQNTQTAFSFLTFSALGTSSNILPKGLFYQSFCLYPEETQPSGTANMRELKGKLYKIVFNKEFLSEYKSLLEQFYGVGNPMVTSKLALSLKFISKNYDMFIVHKGQGKLLFSY
jgi:hypothetical protein